MACCSWLSWPARRSGDRREEGHCLCLALHFWRTLTPRFKHNMQHLSPSTRGAQAHVYWLLVAPLSTHTSLFCQARLAQSAERKALNLVVVGSSPTVGALFGSEQRGLRQ